MGMWRACYSNIRDFFLFLWLDGDFLPTCSSTILAISRRLDICTDMVILAFSSRENSGPI